MNYTVFFYDSLVFFGHKKELLPQGYLYADFIKILPDDMEIIISGIKAKQKIKHYFVITKDVEKTFMLFSSYFNILQSAGGLVLNDKDDILMIHRFNHWDFPKGNIEENEQTKDAAIREVIEETGIKDVSITKELSKVYHIYDYADDWILKETFWYLMYSEYAGILTPQLEEDIVAAKWVSLDFLNEYIQDSYPGLALLVAENKLLR